MATNEIINKIEEIKELEELIEEAKAQAEALRDDLKAHMESKGVEEMTAGQYIVRFTSVLSSRFDTKRFKEKFGEDVYKAFTKEVASRRFTIA